MIFRAACFALLAGAGPAFAACSEGRIEIRGDFGQAGFNVEVADDDAERSVGLMNRETLATSAGMLFVYETPRRAAFWMRNTLIPLDMIFADETGRVLRIHENAVPLDETVIDGGEDIQFVLEINGGLAGAMGIEPGSEFRHPSIPDGQAAWPCEDAS
ncbi:MAG: DUF192 domain-containing protein [Pseudomonadota bacterium]